MELKGTIQIGSKTYKHEVKDGVYFIDGKPADEFIETLSLEDKIRIAKVGKMALQDEIAGITPPKGKYRYYAME